MAYARDPTFTVTDGLHSVAYWEDAERSPTMSFASGQSRVERTYYCAQTDLDFFIYAMLGYPRIAQSDLYGHLDQPAYAKRRFYIKRHLPHSTVFPAAVGSR